MKNKVNAKTIIQTYLLYKCAIIFAKLVTESLEKQKSSQVTYTRNIWNVKCSVAECEDVLENIFCMMTLWNTFIQFLSNCNTSSYFHLNELLFKWFMRIWGWWHCRKKITVLPLGNSSLPRPDTVASKTNVLKVREVNENDEGYIRRDIPKPVDVSLLQ